MEGRLEESLRRVEEGPGFGATRVVHDDVDPPELPDGRVHQAGQVRRVADVGRMDEGTPAESRDLGGHLLQLLGGTGGDHHVGTLFGEGEGRAAADAAPRPRDDGDLVVETESVEEHGR